MESSEIPPDFNDRALAMVFLGRSGRAAPRHLPAKLMILFAEASDRTSCGCDPGPDAASLAPSTVT
jgi:hypothetical protein